MFFEKKYIYLVVSAMVVGICRIDIYIPGSNSLKNKRSVIKRIIHKLRSKYNVSACELDNQDAWRHATLGLAYVSNDNAVVDRAFSSIEELLESNGEIEVTGFNTEIL